jgi:hypothetical protein
LLAEQILSRDLGSGIVANGKGGHSGARFKHAAVFAAR